MNSRTKILLILIVIIATFFRLYHITVTPPGLYPDEAMDGTNAQHALHTGDFRVYYPENNGREGLFMNIQALLVWATGINEPWMLRLPSAIFGILTVLGIYSLGKELFSENAGLLSAFLLATNFWHINFSRISFRAIMAPFILVWAIYIFLLALRKAREGIPRYYFLATVAGIFYGLGFYTYIAFRVTPLLLLLFIPFYRKDKNFWRVLAVFLLATFIVALPIGIYYLKYPADFFGRTSQISIFSSGHPMQNLFLNTIKTIGMLDIHGDDNWRHNISGKPELFWPVGILFWIGICVGMRNIIKPRDEHTRGMRFAFLLLFIWLILAALPVVISNEGIPHALRSLLLVPAIMLFAGFGGVWLYEILKKYLPSRMVLLRTGVAIFFVLVFVSGYKDYFITWAQNPNVPGAFSADYLEIGRILNTLPSSTPKYVAVDAGGVLVRGIPMPSQPIMFITDTFDSREQNEKNIHYILPRNETSIPPNAIVFHIK